MAGNRSQIQPLNIRLSVGESFIEDLKSANENRANFKCYLEFARIYKKHLISQ